MASFEAAHTVVGKNEGGYANIAADKGGETYAGISRKAWPNWSGWSVIDAAKPLKTNARVAAAQPHVGAFYRANYWDKQGLSGLRDQRVANIVMDTLVQHGRGATLVQKAAQALGAKLAVDGAVGAGTVAAINSVDPSRYADRLLTDRMNYYKSLSSWSDFGPGWTNRLQALGMSSVKVAAGGAGAVLAIGLGILAFRRS